MNWLIINLSINEITLWSIVASSSFGRALPLFLSSFLIRYSAALCPSISPLAGLSRSLSPSSMLSDIGTGVNHSKSCGLFTSSARHTSSCCCSARTHYGASIVNIVVCPLESHSIPHACRPGMVLPVRLLLLLRVWLPLCEWRRPNGFHFSQVSPV